MRDDDDAATTAGGALAVCLIVAAIFLLASLGLLWDRPASKYAEETRKQVYETSRQYQQGTQLDLDRYCRQWRTAIGPARVAVADLIHDTAATYAGPLTPANQACLQEVGQ